MKSSKSQTSSLENVIVAVEPPIKERSLSLARFAATIKSYQEAEVLPSVSIVSLIHSTMYMVPVSWYYENRNKYAIEANVKVDQACQKRFEYNAIEILQAKSSANHFLVEQLSDFLRTVESDLLVVLASNRTGVPYWLLGSFAETAALTCAKSVMVIKPNTKLELSTKPRITLAIDADAKYTQKDIRWLIAFALPAKVQLDLLFVQKQPNKVLSILRSKKKPKTNMKELEIFINEFSKAGIKTTLTITKAENSVSEPIVEFANKKKSWGIITISTERSLTRQLLLGSTARKILTLTHRPFISVRTR